MRIYKNYGYVLFSLNPSEMAKRLLYNCYQGLEGLKEQKSTFQ